MPAVITTSSALMSFALRSYDSATDTDFILTSWVNSYARSAYGVARGAHVASPIRGLSSRPRDIDWAAFWTDHKPIVVKLLACSDVTVACDPEAPEVIWGYCCTDGSDTLHQVLVKRSIHRASAAADESGQWSVTTGISGDIYRALLGGMLGRATGYTHDPVDMRRKELRTQGIDVPRSWYPDTTWFARSW